MAEHVYALACMERSGVHEREIMGMSPRFSLIIGVEDQNEKIGNISEVSVKLLPVMSVDDLRADNSKRE